MEQQVQELKLNVTNIKSILIKENKRVRKLDIKKKRLLDRQEKLDNRRFLEKRIEMPKIGSIPIIGGIGTRIGGIASSFTSRLFNFLGYLVMGLLFTKLPQIIKGFQSSLNVVEPIWKGALSALGAVFNGVKTLHESMTSLFKPAELTKQQEEIEKLTKELDELNKSLDKDVQNIEEVDTSEIVKRINDSEEIDQETKNKINQLENPTPSQILRVLDPQLGQDLSDKMFEAPGSEERIESEKGSDIINELFGNTNNNDNQSQIKAVPLTFKVSKKNDNIPLPPLDEDNSTKIFIQPIEIAVPVNGGSSSSNNQINTPEPMPSFTRLGRVA